MTMHDNDVLGAAIEAGPDVPSAPSKDDPLTSSPTLLKLDVEGFEYEVLQKMLVDNYLLPLQIQIELHWGTKMVDVPWMLRTITSAELALFFGMMYASGGYLPMHRVDACPVCQEVLFGRVLC